jgi:uncharacterized membrane protein
MTLDGVRRAESHARSFVKGVSWRVVGTLDTFLWSWLITHKPVAAGTIALLETVTKVVLYYGHERLWHLIPWSPDGHGRAIVKAVAWRFVGSLDTFILSLLVTGKLHYAVSIAGIEALTKILLFYLHERAWRLVRWGKVETAPPPPSATA